MPDYIAQVELRFEADNLAACGSRLKEFADLGKTIGFVVSQGRVEPAPLMSADSEKWTRYAP